MYHEMKEDIINSLLNKNIFETFLIEEMTKPNSKKC